MHVAQLNVNHRSLLHLSALTHLSRQQRYVKLETEDDATAHSAELLSSRKAERKTDDDNKIRSSLSEVQEKYFKRLLREHKTIVENLSAEVTLVKQRINESEVKLALELEENDINEKIYKTNDTQRLSTPVSSQGQIEKNRLLPI